MLVGVWINVRFTPERGHSLSRSEVRYGLKADVHPPPNTRLSACVIG